MDPLTIAGLAIGGLTSLYSASQQRKQGQQTAGIELWRAGQERDAAYKEAGSVGAAAVDQAVRSTRAYTIAADIARSNQVLAGQKGQLAENVQREQTARTLGAQTAFFAGGNIDPSYGSPLVLAAAGAAQGEADAAIIRANTAQEVAKGGWDAYSAAEAADYGVKSASATIAGAFDTAVTRANSATSTALVNAQNARKAGVYGAATTLLNTASKWGTSYAFGGLRSGSTA